MDRVNWYYRQIVTEAELDLAFTQVENALQNAAMDSAIIGLVSGGDLVELGPPNMNVEVDTPLIATDQEGNRIYAAAIDPVDISVDSSSVSTDVSGPGQEKYVSVFIQYDVILSDERIDGNSNPVFFLSSGSYSIIVEQGAEAGAGFASPPSLKADALLLGDVLRYDGQTTVVTADIDLARQQTAFDITSISYDIKAGTPAEVFESVLQIMSDHVDTGAVGAHRAANIEFNPTGTNYDAGIEEVQAALEAAHVLAAPYPGNLIRSPDRWLTRPTTGDWRDSAYMQFFTFAGSGAVPGGGGNVEIKIAGIAAADGDDGFIELEDNALYKFSLDILCTCRSPGDANFTYRSQSIEAVFQRQALVVTALLSSNDDQDGAPANIVLSLQLTATPEIVIRAVGGAVLAGFNIRISAMARVQRVIYGV